jgi:hypothetical protein
MSARRLQLALLEACLAAPSASRFPGMGKVPCHLMTFSRVRYDVLVDFTACSSTRLVAPFAAYTFQSSHRLVLSCRQNSRHLQPISPSSNVCDDGDDETCIVL